MTVAVARTRPSQLQSKASEHVVAIFYHGVWKETRLVADLDSARETARDVHRRTGLIVQVRDPQEAIVAQFGYPVTESFLDDTTWVDED